MKRLFCTVYCGKPVGVYDTGKNRLRVDYENPQYDAHEYKNNDGSSFYSTFGTDYGSSGELEVLSDYARSLSEQLKKYEDKESMKSI